MIQGFMIAASDVDDDDGRSYAVDIVIRVYHEDLEDRDDLRDVVRHVGGRRIGFYIEDGAEVKVLSVVERKAARKAKGAPDGKAKD